VPVHRVRQPGGDGIPAQPRLDASRLTLAIQPADEDPSDLSDDLVPPTAFMHNLELAR
jgi:hypothetical protein